MNEFTIFTQARVAITKAVRKFGPGMVLMYMLTAVFCGNAITNVMPAVNWRGGAYVGLTWPFWISGGKLPVLPIPGWAFTFD